MGASEHHGGPTIATVKLDLRLCNLGPDVEGGVTLHAHKSQAHRALSCSGATRSDVIVTPEGEVTLLEVNTLPGMTTASLLPKIAAGRGMSFTELCERLLAGASLKA